MRKFWTLLKTLAEILNRHRGNSHSAAAWSVACCSTTTPCGNLSTTTNNFIENTIDDSAPAESFFLPKAKKPGLVLLKGYSLAEDQGLQNEKRAAEKRLTELLVEHNRQEKEFKIIPGNAGLNHKKIIQAVHFNTSFNYKLFYESKF